MPAPGLSGCLACAVLLFALMVGVAPQNLPMDAEPPIRAIIESGATEQLVQVQAAALATPIAINGYRRRSRLQIPHKDVPAGVLYFICIIPVDMLGGIGCGCMIAAVPADCPTYYISDASSYAVAKLQNPCGSTGSNSRFSCFPNCMHNTLLTRQTHQCTCTGCMQARHCWGSTSSCTMQGLMLQQLWLSEWLHV